MKKEYLTEEYIKKAVEKQITIPIEEFDVNKHLAILHQEWEHFGDYSLEVQQGLVPIDKRTTIFSNELHLYPYSMMFKIYLGERHDFIKEKKKYDFATFLENKGVEVKRKRSGEPKTCSYKHLRTDLDISDYFEKTCEFYDTVPLIEKISRIETNFAYKPDVRLYIPGTKVNVLPIIECIVDDKKDESKWPHKTILMI